MTLDGPHATWRITPDSTYSHWALLTDTIAILVACPVTMARSIWESLPTTLTLTDATRVIADVAGSLDSLPHFVILAPHDHTSLTMAVRGNWALTLTTDDEHTLTLPGAHPWTQRTTHGVTHAHIDTYHDDADMPTVTDRLIGLLPVSGGVVAASAIDWTPATDISVFNAVTANEVPQNTNVPKAIPPVLADVASPADPEPPTLNDTLISAPTLPPTHTESAPTVTFDADDDSLHDGRTMTAAQLAALRAHSTPATPTMQAPTPPTTQPSSSQSQAQPTQPITVPATQASSMSHVGTPHDHSSHDRPVHDAQPQFSQPQSHGDNRGLGVILDADHVPFHTPSESITVMAALCLNQHPNPTHATTCRQCDSPVTGQTVRIERPALGSLVCSSGSRVRLDNDVIIGRSPTPHTRGACAAPYLMAVPSPSKAVSKSHCAIRVDGWDVSLEDLGSTNGTYLLRAGSEPIRLIGNAPHFLRAGDVIDIGDNITLTVESA